MKVTRVLNYTPLEDGRAPAFLKRLVPRHVPEWDSGSDMPGTNLENRLIHSGNVCQLSISMAVLRKRTLARSGGSRGLA